MRIFESKAGLICLLVVLMCGCSTVPQSDYGAVELISAGGTVTLDGEPLADAVVTFDAEDGQFAYGLTDDSGRYQLHFDSVKMGVTPGKKIIRISTTRKILGLNTEEDGGGGAEAATEGAAAEKLTHKEEVPDKYNRHSELKEEVTPDKTTYDFDLKSK